MRKILFSLVALSIFSSMQAQKKKTKPSPKPKLIVGIVVDQMRYDYLYRFQAHYSQDGFNRLLNDGFNLENAHYNYAATKTAVGHSSIYTGTTPSEHGIIGNDWYDKFSKSWVYCVQDSTYTGIGSQNGGDKSPHRLVSTTLSDEIRYSTGFRGKSIGIAMKDRSAILPVGHSANAAYWFEGHDEGVFMSSTYYMNELPLWVDNFNKSGKAENYLNQVWNTLKPINTYTESTADDNSYETILNGKEKPVFPYDLPALRSLNGNFDLLKEVPFMNNLTTDFALAAIEGEQLGQDNYTDILAISYSQPDYVGHGFGVDSKELQDTYVRLDRELARLLDELDKRVGKGNYTVFLSADHGAIPVPNYLKDHKIPAGYLNKSQIREEMRLLCETQFGHGDMIESYSNDQVFIRQSAVDSVNTSKDKVAAFLAEQMINHKDVYRTITAKTLRESEFSQGMMHLVQLTYNQKRSGDLIIVTKPNYISYSQVGSTHGSGYTYDTHIPILFYGNGIKKGDSNQYYRITDIAPTIANLLNFSLPNITSGEVVKEALNK